MVTLSSREAEDEICAGVGLSLLVYTVLHPRQEMEPFMLSGSLRTMTAIKVIPHKHGKPPVSHTIVDLSR